MKASRRTMRGMAIAGALLVAMGSTAAYAGGSVSTKLSNGTLYFEAHNGREIGQSSNKVFSGVRYKKDSGATVTAILHVMTDKINAKSAAKTVKAGQTISYSYTFPVSDTPDCSAAGVMTSGGSWFETPSVYRLC
ncbi:hypothetical protein [Streptomyces sp. NPDC093707]|uniref:hypothetical protein n=1 Tax=Streptomyces sp. NPDC093707 TaxID=3154984 RepID=UPI00344B4136